MIPQDRSELKDMPILTTESIPWLEWYLNRLRELANDANKESSLASAIGSEAVADEQFGKAMALSRELLLIDYILTDLIPRKS